MIAGAELSVLVMNIELMKDAAETVDKWIYIEVLEEIRKTRDKVIADDLKALAAIKTLADTYIEIQAM